MVPNLWERSTQSTQSTQQKTLKCFNWRQASVCSWLSDATSTGFVAACPASVGPAGSRMSGTSRMSSITAGSKKSDQNISKPPPSPSGAAFCTGFLWERLQCCGPCSRVSFAHGGKAAAKQENTVPCLSNQERPFRDIQI